MYIYIYIHNQHYNELKLLNIYRYTVENYPRRSHDIVTYRGNHTTFTCNINCKFSVSKCNTTLYVLR